jgi:hypothetical protein
LLHTGEPQRAELLALVQQSRPRVFGTGCGASQFPLQIAESYRWNSRCQEKQLALSPELREKATLAKATIIDKLDAANRAILEISRNAKSLGIQPEVVIMANCIQHITAAGTGCQKNALTGQVLSTAI